ncbi:helix-turn-helix transcriptional regulator [Eubacterium sp.]|uniref:helix-turn-helix transcriptional regulator n=1 Tax=Eubacterium sp. TaxID=142586 RepID=UPI002FC7024B
MHTHERQLIIFVQSVLERRHIYSHILEGTIEWHHCYDAHLREHLWDSTDFIIKDFPIRLKEKVEDHTLYFYTDSYECSYALLRIPGEHPCFFYIGPFLYEAISSIRAEELCIRAGVPAIHKRFMYHYYAGIPSLSDGHWFKEVLYTLAETLWGSPEHYTIVNTRETPSRDTRYAPNTIEATSDRIRHVEDRYHLEAKLINALAHGQEDIASDIMEKQHFPGIKPRFSDSIRNMRNHLIIFNTLCRKSAEQGGVIAFYLDDLSEKFAFAIEETDSLTGLHDLQNTMIQKYCHLVREMSLKGYSQIIRNVINFIYSNLDNTLSLGTLAREFCLNDSYLSTLFKKETGMTLTSFVNTKRIEHAAYLLDTTLLPIQEIATLCGVQDMSYFSKIFKKHMGFSPREYREEHLQR